MTGYQDKEISAISTPCIDLPIGGIGGRLPDFIFIFAPLSSLKSEGRLKKKSHSLTVNSSAYSKKPHFLMVCEVYLCFHYTCQCSWADKQGMCLGSGLMVWTRQDEPSLLFYEWW